MLRNLSQIIINTPVLPIDFGDGGYKVAEGHKTFNLKNLILSPSKELVSRCGFIKAAGYKDKELNEEDVTLHRCWISPYRGGDFFLYISCWKLETATVEAVEEQDNVIRITWDNNQEGYPEDYFQYWRRTDEIQIQYLEPIPDSDEIGEARYWEIDAQNHADLGNTTRVKYSNNSLEITLTDAEMEHFNSLSERFASETEGFENGRVITNKVKIHVGRLCYIDKDKDDVQYMKNEVTGWSYFPYSIVQTGIEHIQGFFIANGVSPFFKVNYNEDAKQNVVTEPGAVGQEQQQEQPKDLYTFKLLQEDVPIRLSDARFWTYNENNKGNYEKHKMKLTADVETGNLKIDCIPTRDSTALVKNNILKLKNGNTIYEGKILKVEYKKQTELETESFGYYEKESKFIFEIENPEWDKTSEQWNGKELFITNPEWTTINNAPERPKDSGIKNGYKQDIIHQFFYKWQNEEAITVLKQIPNPELPGNNEDERWLLFYDAKPKAIPPEDDERRVGSIEYQNPKTRVIELGYHPGVTSTVVGDNQMHCYITLDIQADERFIEQREHLSQQFSIKDWELILLMPCPKLSVVYQYHGYLYGIGLADIHNNFTKETYTDRYLLYRTTITGNASKWFDPAHASFYFQDLKSYFPQNDYPITLISNQQYLYVVGTKFTQVWLPRMEPAQAVIYDQDGNIKTPGHIDIFGKYITTFECGCPAPGLAFIHANFVSLINDEGMWIINPFTLNDKPELIKGDIHEGLIRELFGRVQQSTWLQSCTFLYRDSYYIKIGNQEQVLFLQDLGNSNFFTTIFDSEVLTHSIPVFGTHRTLLLANIKNNTVSFYQYRDDPAIYIDENNKPIECRWDFSMMSPNNKVWQNLRINLNVEHEGKEPLKANVRLINRRNYHSDITKEIEFSLQNQHLPDMNRGSDFVFKDNFVIMTQSVRFLTEMLSVYVTINVKNKLTINNFIFIGGVANAINKY